jgi:hypothetical protein
VNKRISSECTPLLANQIDKDAYYPKPYAFKIVRDDDKEKLMAH